MKQMKRMMALVIAMVMMLAMAVPVFAADPTYSITVTNTNETISIAGKTYSAYKLFDMTYNSDKTAYSYSIDSDGDGAWAWSTLISGLTAGTDGSYTNSTYGMKFVPSAADASVYSVQLVDTNGKYPGETGYNSASLVFTEAKARTLADALEAVKPSTNNGSATVASGAETCTINTSPNAAGYYMVYGTAAAANPDTSDGEIVAAVALTSTDPTATVNQKADVPHLDKTIFAVTEAGSSTETENAVYADGLVAVAKAGSTVTFHLDSEIPDMTGYDEYTFYMEDTMSDGLTFDPDSVKVYIYKADDANTTVDNSSEYLTSNAPATSSSKAVYTSTTRNTKGQTVVTNYNTDPDETGALAATFRVTFNDFLKLAAYKGYKILVTYDAKVNDTALTYDYENNTANLTYSRNPYDDSTNHTPDVETYIIDLNLDVDKVAESSSGTKLKGAKFKLYREVGTSTPKTKEFYKWDDTNKKVTWVTEAQAQVFETGTDGHLSSQVLGLDKGTYFFLETEAPEGYNPLPNPVEVTITVTTDFTTGNKKVTYTATYDGQNAAVANGAIDLSQAQAANKQPVATGVIINNGGSVLPSTGGIGTTIFYVIGAILVLGAGILLVTRRRMNAN